MKNTLLFVTVLFSILFIANTSEPISVFSPLVVTSLEETPVLPKTPYKYGFHLPNHLVNASTTDPGYGSGPIDTDTTILPLIDPNIATLGRVLFYDKVLSANEDISCGSCHVQSKSFADNHALSTGVSTDTKRNSMHLNDLGWSNNKFFFWDLRHNNLKGAVSLPLKDANEIGATIDDIRLKMSVSSYYPQLFENAFGTEEVTEDKILIAIEKFIMSMNTTKSKFDQIMAGREDFSSKEAKGRDIFSKDCSGCHVQGTHSFFDNMNIKDRATITFNGYVDEDGDKGATTNVVNLPALFKMPSLRNISVTAPYMHDGGIPDLDSLINFYSHGTQATTSALLPEDGFQYSDLEKDQLKSFLLTLTDEEFLKNIKWSDPFELTSGTINITADIAVKPNPSFDYAQITIDGKNGQRKDLFVTDMTGRRISQDYFTGNNYELDVQNFTSGIYMLTIKVGNEMGSYKLIKN